MKDIKNYLIAILAGLLVFSLVTGSNEGGPKQYDEVKLAEYSACLQTYDKITWWTMEDVYPLIRCAKFRP